MQTSTIEYYNDNANKFSDSTFEVEFSNVQEWFIKYIQLGSYILDFGCGAGRDTKYFHGQGYRVDALDGSKSLCEIASENTGIEVKHQRFDELIDIEKYDGIWACASILHLPYSELKEVLGKISMALKAGGILYMSFKYGTFEGVRNGRYFTDMTLEKMEKLIDDIMLFDILEVKITSDVRKDKGEEKWLNVILRKI